MNTEIRNELINNASSRVHQAWCDAELQAFYLRLAIELENKQPIPNALHNACLKNGKPRNEVEFDTSYILNNIAEIRKALTSFEGFMELVKTGKIVVKRFTKRELTEQEQQNAGTTNYHAETQEENILRPFRKLSEASKKENLEAAKGAAYVYEEYCKRGAVLEQFSTEKAKEAVGTMIHAFWMSRNEKTPANEYLFVPYDKLDAWAKQQDLDVFFALLEEVKMFPKRYYVEFKQNLNLPEINPKAYENSVLAKVSPEFSDAKDTPTA